MRKLSRIGLTASMVGALLLGGIAAGPAAGATPRHLASTGLLAPAVHFTFGGDGSLGQFGASVGVSASYRCSTPLDSPVVPQLLGSSSVLTLQITQDIAHNATQSITQASRTITDLRCDGSTHSGPIYAATSAGMVPLLSGPSVAVMTMRVCDLLGCSSASSVGLVYLS